jgi:CheY-like chemotaxis protein
VLLHRHARARFVAATALALEKHIPTTQAEMFTFGIDHVRTGEDWSLKVELPPSLQAVMRFHHERVAALPDIVDKELRDLIAIVQIADAHCEAHGIGKGGDAGDWPRELRMILHLREEDWPAEPQLIKRDIEAMRETFGFPKYDIKKLPAEPRDTGQNPGRALLLRRKNPVRAVPRQVIPLQLPSDAVAKRDDKTTSGKLAILVVEDHSSLCDLLSLYLMRHGYHVRTATNGEGALEILSKEEIHLILLDLMLPRVDGFEVLRQVHKTQRDKTPYIIVVSAGASERDRKKVIELGADEYMPKPFHLLRLLERIQVVEKYLR